jgi:hypothetical protein
MQIDTESEYEAMDDDDALMSETGGTRARLLGIDDVMSEMRSLRELMSAPRELIRDAEGRVIGVRTQQEMADAG